MLFAVNYYSQNMCGKTLLPSVYVLFVEEIDYLPAINQKLLLIRLHKIHQKKI